MSLLSYLTNKPDATPVNASFEVDATENQSQYAPQASAPQAAETPAPGKRLKLIGKKLNQPAVSAQGKNLTVIASSMQPATKPAPKLTRVQPATKPAPKLTRVQPASKPSAIAQKPAPKLTRVQKIAAKPVAKKAAAVAAGAKKLFAKPGVKKAAIIGAAAAMPIAAGAYLAIKNRKAIAAGAKKVIKKMPKIKLGKKRR